MRFFLVLTTLVLSSLSWAQQPKRPCDLPEGKQFDFWLGVWEVSWKGPDGKVSKGTNTVQKILDSCIVEEHFQGGPLEGKSYSVYDPQSKLWKQTWIDNQGSYIALSGWFKDGKMELRTGPRKGPSGKTAIFRMVFRNITADGLQWDWQQSEDNGKTWTDAWLITYKRKS